MARRSLHSLRSPARAGVLVLGVLLAGLWSPLAQLCCVVETSAPQDRQVAERTELRLMVHVPPTRKLAAADKDAAPSAHSKSKPAQPHFQRPFSGETDAPAEPSVAGRGGQNPLAGPASGFATAFAAVVPVRTSGPAPPDPGFASTPHPSSTFAAAYHPSRAARGPPAV